MSHVTELPIGQQERSRSKAKDKDKDKSSRSSTGSCSSSRSSGKRKKTIMSLKSLKILTKKYSKCMKSSGELLREDFSDLVQCPRTHTLDDWLIVNAVEFLDRVEILFLSCSLFCTVSTCPLFTAGPHYHYLWEDETTPRPVQVSAPEYFNALKRWIRRQLTNEKLFGTDKKKKGGDSGGLSDEAMAVLGTAYRRLFRILAHMYMCHFSSLRKFNMEPVINTMLAHYTTFAIQYNLIDPSDLEMLSPVFRAMGLIIEGINEVDVRC